MLEYENDHQEQTTYMVPPAQAWSTNLPFTHCANWSFTQACSPAVQGESGVSVANFWLE